MLLWCLAPAQAPHPTAVFTLDVVHERLPANEAFETRFRQWLRTCEIRPGGPLHKLECLPHRPSAPQTEPEESASVASAQPAPKGPPATTVAVALFRDLDETLYLAGCPVLRDALADQDEPLEQPSENQPAPDSPSEATEQSLFSLACADLEAGQTFSAEVQEGVITIVFRGRQLPLTLFETRPKRLSLGDPRSPKVSTTPPSSRKAIDPATLPSQPSPQWSPPPLEELSGTTAAATPGPGVSPAKTSVRTGRVVVGCGRGPAAVYIDDVYMGVCPIDMPLIAGRHSATVKQQKGPDWIRQFEVAAGETVRLEVKGDTAARP